MHNFTETKSGILFSGVFTNNTVLQREPHYASIYGTCDTSNTTIILSIKNENNQTFQNYSTISQSNGDWKITLPQTYPNGGNYTLIAYCNHCISYPNYTIIYNITFGDILLCSGQSNMNLEMHFTFNAKHTYNNITELGKYSNIRFFTKRPWAIYNNISSYIIPAETDIINGKYQWHIGSNIKRVNLFSATCWYTVQSLIDIYNMSDINFGLILTAIDGSQIQPWIMNNTISTNISNGALFNGMIKPFVNMSIKIFLWYQGENNIHQQEIGIVNNSLYSSLQKLMINQYRMLWNNSNLPFGIVQIAAGDSEGYKYQMPYFRHSQTFNYGIVPNEEMRNVFIAQAYDIGDPWFTYARERNQYPAPYDWNTTHWFLGSIHPRPKLYIGQRMAMNINRFVYGHEHIWNGPLIKGCHLNVEYGIIILHFHENILYNEIIVIQPLDLWYNKSLEINVKYHSSIQLLINGVWIQLDGNILSVGNNGYDVIVNVSNVGNILDINGISYAWSDYPCCGNLDRKYHPCPMNRCPLITSKSRLPALPFQARIVNNKCQCTLPQKCDGSGYVYPGVYIDAEPTTTDVSTEMRRTLIATGFESDGTIVMETTNNDFSKFICVSFSKSVKDSNINGMQGQYEKDNEFMLYWTKMDAKRNKYDIYYAELSGKWEIGSVHDEKHNLVCNVDINSLIECDQWFDYNGNEINYIILSYGKCTVGVDIKTLNEESDGNDISHSIFDDKIKITLYVILIECLCICICCIYCKRDIIWMNIRYRNSNDGRHELVTSDPNEEIDIQRLNPMDIDEALDPGNRGDNPLIN